MVDTGRLAQLRQELTQKNQTAMAEAKFGMAAQYARALDALQRWEEGGQRDEPPMDVARLLKINWTDLLQTGPAAQPKTQTAPPAVVPELSRSEAPTPVPDLPVAQVTTDAPAKTPHTPETIAVPVPNVESHSWQEMLARANDNLRRGNLTDAEMEANEVVARADNPAFQQQAKAILNEALSQRRRQLNDALARARQAGRTQSGNFDLQQQLWEAVLQLAPDHDHNEADEELEKLTKRRAEAEQRQQLEQLRQELEDLRKPLTAGRKDIRQVEHARTEAERIRNDDKTYSPERRQEANEIYTRLDELRQSIQRASDGGTSSERSEEFAHAVDVYRRAIQAGYAVIVDDATGEPVEVVPALTRAREALFKQLIGRVSTRYNEALEDIKAGAPETAVDKLVQCQELLTGVEEGGEKIRAEVATLLEKARDQLRNKEKAYQLVVESEREDLDPATARTKLIQARQVYASYPGIDDLIRNKETALLRKLFNDIDGDLTRARSALNASNFAAAQQFCEQALGRGQNLSLSNDDLDRKRRETQGVRDQVAQRQSAWLNLQEKLKRIRVALEQQPKPNLALAKRLLGELSDEERLNGDAGELATRVDLLGEAEDIWMNAQRAFYNDQNYPRAIELCKGLTAHPEFEKRATELQQLQHRAEARDWQAKAGAAALNNKITGEDGTEANWRRIVGLRGLLPQEDQSFLEAAEQAIRKLDVERRQQAMLQQEFDNVQALRVAAKWPAWQKALQELEKKAPSTMVQDLSDEREAGLEEWQATACPGAEQLKFDKKWREAYLLLQPLYEFGVLKDGDPLYGEIALNYHKTEAAIWEQSSRPEDLDKAIEHRRNALGFAPKPAVTERQELTTAIRRRAVRLAELKATNPGPQEALKVLQQNMVDYHEDLTEDPVVRCHLISYGLQARAFDVARKEAEALQYVPGYREQAPVWQRLVDAISIFYDRGGQAVELWEQGVQAFVKVTSDAMTQALTALQVRSSNTDMPFADPRPNFTSGMSAHMNRSLPPASPSLTNEQVLHRVRVYGLMLQLQPKHVDATQGINYVSGRLKQLGADLSQRLNRIKNASQRGGAELAQAEALESEVSALEQAFKLVEQEKTPMAQQLVLMHRELERHIQGLRQATQGVSQIEGCWRKTIGETWQMDELETALSDARKAGGGRELDAWDDRIERLRSWLEKLEVTTTTIEKNWAEQKYSEAVVACNTLEDRLSQARMDLREDGINVPSDRPEVYDAQRRQPVRRVDAIRQAAQAKAANQADWQEWITRFKTTQTEANQARTTAKELLSKTPPHLSKAQIELETILGKITDLKALLPDRPREALSQFAEQAAKAFSGDLDTLLGREEKTMQKQLEDVQARLKRIEKPLVDLEGFRRGGRDLTRPANRRLLETLILAAQAIDGAHPAVEPYQKLLDRFKSSQ